MSRSFDTLSQLGRVRPVSSVGAAYWPALDAVPLWLRMDWWRRAGAGGWPEPRDWYHPAVDAVSEALTEGSDPRPALVRLGAARAAYGATVTECLIDVTALWAAFAAQPAPLDVLTHVLEGWGEHVTVTQVPDSWQDPTTGLATVGYLRGRLEEMGRGGATADHVYVVAQANAPAAPLVQARRSAVLAGCLRETFVGGETLVALGGPRVLALTAREGSPEAVRRLWAAVESREHLLGNGDVTVWTAEPGCGIAPGV